MKILLEIDSLGSGGAQKQMTLLAAGLQRRGHSVTLFLYYPQYDFYRDALDASGVRIVSVQKKSRFDLSPVMALRRALQTDRYDAAIAFMSTPGLYLLAARGLARTPPVIVSHRLTYSADYIPLADRTLLSSYAMANAIVSNSYRGAEQIAAALPFLQRKLSVIQNGVDLKRFAALPRCKVATQDNLLFVGRLSQEKNIHRLLDALALMRANGVELPRILWAGRTETGATGGAYAAMIEQRVTDLDLSANWTALGERNDIPNLLADCDALVLPSIFEGTPNVVCEALAAGRPVLASYAGDNDRLVADGMTGFVFNPFNISDIANTIEKFLRMNMSVRADFGAAARRFAEKNLSMDAYVDNWEKMLLQVLKTSASRSTGKPECTGEHAR